MLRKLGILLVLIIAGVGVGTYWFWRQATALPDWYVEQPAEPPSAAPGAEPPQPPVLTGADVDESSEIQAMRANLEKKVSRSLTPVSAPAQPSGSSAPKSFAPNPAPATSSSPKPSPRLDPEATAPPPSEIAPPIQATPAESNTHTVELDADAFNELVITSIPANSENQTILQAIKAINTEIVEGELKTGLVIAPDQIPMDQLPSKYRSSLQQAFQAFPFLKQQDVYVGIVGQPRLEAGQVVLDETTQVQIGSLTLPLVDVTERLGIPLSTLEKNINLQVGQLKVKDIDFADRTAILKGAVD